MKVLMSQRNYQMEGKSSQYLDTPEMSHKILKREVRSKTSVDGQHTSKKKSKKPLQGSTKSKRRSILYEYEMKSRLTWEFADVFQNIDNWHESLKGEASDRKPIYIEPQMMKNENVDEIHVSESSLGNASTVDDRQDQKAGVIENDPVGRRAGRCTTTSNDTVMTDSTAPVNKPSVNFQTDASPKNSVRTAVERHATSSDDICCEETLEETTEKSRGSPRCLKRKSINDEIIRKPGACDNLEIRTPEAHIELFHHNPELFHRNPEMLEQQELPNVGVNNNTIGVETHANRKQDTKNPVTVRREKPYQCPQCPQMFLRKIHLTRHYRVHSGEKPFKCTECPKKFSLKSTLTIHLRIHSGEKPFKCTACPKMFSQKSHLTRHQRIHSGEKPFKCTECSQIFSCKSHLTRHLRTHSGEKPFKCTACPKMCSQKSDLTKHLRVHSGEKPFKCTECSQIFSYKSNLVTHQRIHLGVKPFKCTECPKMFSHKSYLKKHQHIHSGEKPFKCNECLKMFSLKSTLTAHQRVHSGEKPFKCTECSQIFSYKSHLTRHRRTHSGVKPFKSTSNNPKETV